MTQSEAISNALKRDPKGVGLSDLSLRTGIEYSVVVRTVRRLLDEGKIVKKRHLYFWDRGEYEVAQKITIGRGSVYGAGLV